MSYASVILPTTARPGTLPLALASVQRQSIREIEILIVLDGALAESREAAEGAARTDLRIRVFDWPKAPDSGEANIHRAIEQARSERIFYIDDDDLWSPDHVAILGRLLDRADIAESRVVTLDRYDGLHLAPCPTGTARLRGLLAAGSHKCVFDTHIAHLKSAYGGARSWVSPNPKSLGPVWKFLAGFAADPEISWAFTAQTTALSIHGAPRRDLSEAARVSEIERWRDQVAGAAWAKTGSAAGHFMRLLEADPPGPQSRLESYLDARGAFDGVAEHAAIRALFEIGSRRQPAACDWFELIDTLVRPLLGKARLLAVNAWLGRAVAAPELERILRAAAEPPGPAQPLRIAAHAVQLNTLGRRAEAGARFDDALATGPDPLSVIADTRARIAVESSRAL